jgi:hypothetical protein
MAIRHGGKVAYDLKPLSGLDGGVQHAEDIFVLVLVVEVLVGAGWRRAMGRSENQNIVDLLVASCTKHLFRPSDVLALILEFREQGERVFLDAFVELLVETGSRR